MMLINGPTSCRRRGARRRSKCPAQSSSTAARARSRLSHRLRVAHDGRLDRTRQHRGPGRIIASHRVANRRKRPARRPDAEPLRNGYTDRLSNHRGRRRRFPSSALENRGELLRVGMSRSRPKRLSQPTASFCNQAIHAGRCRISVAIWRSRYGINHSRPGSAAQQAEKHDADACAVPVATAAGGHQRRTGRRTWLRSRTASAPAQAARAPRRPERSAPAPAQGVVTHLRLRACMAWADHTTTYCRPLATACRPDQIEEATGRQVNQVDRFTSVQHTANLRQIESSVRLRRADQAAWATASNDHHVAPPTTSQLSHSGCRQAERNETPDQHQLAAVTVNAAKPARQPQRVWRESRRTRR